MSKRALAALAALGLAAFVAGGTVALADDEGTSGSSSSDAIELTATETPSATMTPSPSDDDDVSPSDEPSNTPSASASASPDDDGRSEEHTSELQSRQYLVCRLLLEKKKHP